MAETLEHEDIRRYCNDDGLSCPNPDCEDGTVEPLDPPRVVGATIHQKVKCLDCNAHWTDVYTISDIVDYSVPDLRREGDE